MNLPLVRSTKTLWSWIVPLLGLLAILSYWYSIRPIGAQPGYTEDLCTVDMARQLLTEEMKEHGELRFHTNRLMTPEGAGVPYMSWTLERDWLGSFFWRWDPSFPFGWVYIAASWSLTFFFLGFILSRMGKTLGFGKNTAWLLAALFVLFHVPRHFKAWHHYEHLLQHWIYLGFFLDAWIWHRFQREKIWDWRLEIWRGFAGIGMMQNLGTFWGPLILEWVVIHASILILATLRWRRGIKTSLPAPDRATRWIAVPIALSIAFIILDLFWYPPLLAEVKKLGTVHQEAGWFANIAFFFRPLWLDPVIAALGLPALQPIEHPETVVTVGWFYWVPAILALFLLRKKRGGPGLVVVGSFFALLVIAVIYASLNEPSHIFQKTIQSIIPTMNFFRVSSRWGLFLPQILAILVILSWPELSAWVKARFQGERKQLWIGVAVVFVALSVVEFSWLRFPVNMSPPMPEATAALLEGVRQAPGTTVLDLPFCVAGGNGTCLKEMCPQYPAMTVAMCLRTYHGKKVHGLYMGRMVEAHCDLYRKPPYEGWFAAWRENRCFGAEEWKGFCDYLDRYPEIGSVLLYADLWRAGGTPECLAQFEAHLGPPIAQGQIMAEASRGGEGRSPTRIFHFPGRCISSRWALPSR